MAQTDPANRQLLQPKTRWTGKTGLGPEVTVIAVDHDADRVTAKVTSDPQQPPLNHPIDTFLGQFLPVDRQHPRRDSAL